MVIGLVSQGYTFLPEHLAALSCRCAGSLMASEADCSEDAAHAVNS